MYLSIGLFIFYHFKSFYVKDTAAGGHSTILKWIPLVNPITDRSTFENMLSFFIITIAISQVNSGLARIKETNTSLKETKHRAF